MTCEVEPFWKHARRRAVERMLYARLPSEHDRYSMWSYRERLARQRSLATWLWDQEFDCMVTINSNDPLFSFERGRFALKGFGALLDRYFLGKRWCEIESRQRTFFVAVPESAGGELHYHILLRFPPKPRRDSTQIARFMRQLTAKLKAKRIFPRGDVHIQSFQGRSGEIDSYHQLCTISYVVKHRWKADLKDCDCIISSEFHLARKI